MWPSRQDLQYLIDSTFECMPTQGFVAGTASHLMPLVLSLQKLVHLFKKISLHVVLDTAVREMRRNKFILVY